MNDANLKVIKTNQLSKYQITNYITNVSIFFFNWFCSNVRNDFKIFVLIQRNKITLFIIHNSPRLIKPILHHFSMVHERPQIAVFVLPLPARTIAHVSHERFHGRINNVWQNRGHGFLHLHLLGLGQRRYSHVGLRGTRGRRV